MALQRTPISLAVSRGETTYYYLGNGEFSSDASPAQE